MDYTRKPGELEIDYTLRLHSVGVDNFNNLLESLIVTGRDYGGLASRLKQRLANFQKRISAIKENGHVEGTSPVPWKVAARVVSPLKVVLTGPGPDDLPVEVEAKDDEELEWIMGVGSQTPIAAWKLLNWGCVAANHWWHCRRASSKG
jgi:hypothetical protein